MATVPASDLPGADLCEVVREALANEGHLLSAGEGIVLRAILALGDAHAESDPVARDALELYARLTLRKDAVFFVADLPYAIDAPPAAQRLVDVGLAWATAGDDALRAVADAPRLRAACARAGLGARGTRAELQERLAGVRWCRESVIVVRHRALLRRVERFCFGRPGVDRSVRVLERMGMVRWAEYAPTGGPGVHPTRDAMRLWERARSGRWRDDAEPVEVALAGRPPAGLSPWRYAVEAVVEAGADSALLERLRAKGARLDVPLVRALEREGRARDALALCESVTRDGRDPGATAREEAVALARTGRRLARSLGVGWCTPALREAPRRVLRLSPGPRVGVRPGWKVDGVRTVEDAVLALPALRARGAVHAENALWTTVFALVFAELYWLPVPGMLPTARRYGPLDLGTPGFAERRASAVEARLAEVAVRGVKPYADAWGGERLAGLDPRMVAAAASVPGGVARVILERLAREGWDAARGLPDVWIPPGAAQRVEEALPSRIGPDASLVEVKGPGDSLQDAQIAWMDRLMGDEISVEVWEVRSSTKTS